MADNNNKTEAPSENPDAGKADDADKPNTAFIELPEGAISLILTPSEDGEGFRMAVFDNIPENASSQLIGIMRALTFIVVNEHQVLSDAYNKSLKGSDDPDWADEVKGHA